MKQEERRKLYKHAAQLRRASSEAREKPKHRPDYQSLSDDDALPSPVEKRRRRHKGSLRQWAEALVEDGDLGQSAQLSGPEPDAWGTVLFATSGRCRVLLADDAVLDCGVAPDLADAQRSELAVGDEVELLVGLDEPTIVGVLPRRSVLSRPDSGPGGRFVERVIAANVDRVVVVAAIREPVIRPRLIDRYLVAIERGGASPIVALTKVDLASSQERELLHETRTSYEALGIPVVACSGTQGVGIDSLRRALQGSVAVLVGQSGVGKSSLLNALAPRLAIATGDTGRSHKGRHTTTASTLYELDEATRVIDTPGVREFGLWELSRDELRGYFHEFDAPAGDCRYMDCSHDHEPDCGVRSAVEAGELSEARFESYLRLLATLR